MRYRHVEVLERGGADKLSLSIDKLEEPGPEEARIAVEYAGVSYGDVLLRNGVIPGGPRAPFTPGFEIVGTVDSVGAEVSGLAPDQRVVALVRQGGYSTGANVAADRLVPIPDGVSSERAAASALNYFVAYQMLHRVAEVPQGAMVVVYGAAGGVGTALLQLAALSSIDVIGVSSAAKRETVTSLGAHHVDYRAEDIESRVAELAPQGVAAVFDPIGGGHFRKSYRLLRRGGHLVAFGQSDALRDGKPRPAVGAWGMIGGIGLRKLRPDGRSTTFYNAWSLEKSHPNAYREDLLTILGLLADGKVEPVVDRILELQDAAEAHKLLESRSATGKIVLRCAVA